MRITKPIGPFWWAKGCSTWARTVDFFALARAVCLGIGLLFGFLRSMRLTVPTPPRNRSFSAERQALSAQTFRAVLLASIRHSRSRASSWAAASAT